LKSPPIRHFSEFSRSARKTNHQKQQGGRDSTLSGNAHDPATAISAPARRTFTAQYLPFQAL
jgi:hypothetical protein